MELPKYSHAAKFGEMGVGIVSKTISDNFGWLFKRNHQEHDFGIDGQIEVVTHAGAVTGQMLAVQIKCGESFLKEKNKWGFVYRGERKHFNYLANYPVPVVICLCDPRTSDCYWIQFRPELTEPTDGGWKLTVPFKNKLADGKAALEALVHPTHDALAELEAYWSLNRLIIDSSVVLYALDQHDVQSLEVAASRAFFDRLRSTKELASRCQGKIEFMFAGYDGDPRELYEIPEVRRYVTELDRALPDLFFFVRTERPTFTLVIFALCQTTITWPHGRSTAEVTRKVSFDPLPVAQFIESHCPALNELTEWLEMSLEEEKKIFYSVVQCLGFPTPSEGDPT